MSPLSQPLAVLIAGVFGSLLGSFLNVCIHRLPHGLSVVTPRSRCPACQQPIAWYDNIPVVSWLALRARCRSCGAPISPQYPLVEAAVAAIWAGSIAWLGMNLHAVSAALFLTLLVGILVTDAQTMLIPDEFSLGGLGAGLALSAAPGGISLADALIGAAVGYGLLWAAGAIGRWWAGREAMGGGDLKMMAMVGSFVGWKGVLMTVFLGSLLGTLVYLPALIRRERHREVPFGIFLALGAAVTLVAGGRLAAWYTTALWPAQ